MHCNCRSLSKSFGDILNLLLPVTRQPSVIAVTETWLTAANCNLFQIPNYVFFQQHRLTKGGGVGIFINSQFNATAVSELDLLLPYLECLFVELCCANHKVLVGCMYRPPNTDIVQFNLALANILNTIDKKRYKSVIIAGDFNIDLSKNDSHSDTTEFCDNFLSHSYMPSINVPTRITTHSQSLIDNIFIKCKNLASAAVIYCDISDHLPIAAVLRTKLSAKKQKSNTYMRAYGDSSISNFNQDLGRPLLWNGLTTASNTDEMFILFHTTFSDCFERHFPLTVSKNKYKKSPRHAWMTGGLIKCCNKKNNLYKKWIKSKKTEDKSKYTKYLSQLKKVLKSAEKTYFDIQLKLVAGNLRKTWAILNVLISKAKNTGFAERLTINGKLVKDKLLIVDAFNNFFVNIGDKLATEIKGVPERFNDYLKKGYINSFAAHLTDPTEVVNIVLNFDSKKSSGYDAIPMAVIKASIELISGPLSLIINSSLTSGCFPDPLKTAKVCPVFKSGCKTDLTNYRPISLLSCFSKLFEKIMYVRLLDYLDHNNIINNAQFGFRKNHSTHMALLNLYDKISAAANNKHYAMGIFIDLSKAFDTLNHEILLSKLYYYGIRGVTLEWFKSYISNRRQYVVIDNIDSCVRPVTCGVPQGSILGPLLFILYINDIIAVSKLLHFILFADDTSLFYSCCDLDVLICTVNTELSKLATWFKANKLSLNVTKTNYMIFGRKTLTIKPVIKIDGTELDQVAHTKFLGILIDDRSSWKDHISLISSKVSRGLGAINRVKYILPAKSLLLLYHTLVYPHLSYCCIAWGSAAQNNLQHLKSLQKRALRLITNSEFRAASKPLFSKLNLLTLEDICSFQTLQFMAKFKLKLLPVSCYNLLDLPNTSKLHNTRSVIQFKYSHYSNNVSKRCLRHRGPPLWDSLPLSTRNAADIHSFTRDVFSFLVDSYKEN